MRVLGIDPGTHKMGVGVVTASGSDMESVYFGVINPKRTDPISKRLSCSGIERISLKCSWRT